MNGQISDPLAVIEWILSHPPTPDSPPQPHISDWQRRFDTEAKSWLATLDRAMLGGFVADRLAWAMAAGYQEALLALIPGLPSAIPAALCVTEAGGNHPRAIETRLEKANGGWRLSGTKTFVTGAETARILLVAATTGTGEDGRPRLRLVRCPADSVGVTVTSLPALPFIPEITHGTLTLDRVAIDPQWVLPGDGYVNHIKPFRTLEDMHVLSAVMGHGARTALSSPLPKAKCSQLFGLMTALGGLAGKDPLAPQAHIVLDGIWSQMVEWIESAEPFWDETNPEIRQRWTRDRPLLEVAQKARTRRVETAWEHFSVSN